jgi:DNA-directed RNA polymerase specialized sigma24 family protein
VLAAQQGDPRAIATLLDGSHAHVQRFARTLCSTPEDAEDATQEALIVLYRKIGTLRATAALASWMFQIVRNECVRRARVTFHKPAPRMAVEPSAEDAALARLELERIARGALGLGLIAAALVLTPRVRAAALLLAAVGLVALRGCPTCWGRRADPDDLRRAAASHLRRRCGGRRRVHAAAVSESTAYALINGPVPRSTRASPFGSAF